MSRITIEALTLDVFEATIEGEALQSRDDEVEFAEAVVDSAQQALDKGDLAETGRVLDFLRDSEPTKAKAHLAGLLTRSRLAPLFQEDARYLLEVRDQPERFLDRVQSIYAMAFTHGWNARGAVEEGRKMEDMFGGDEGG